MHNDIPKAMQILHCMIFFTETFSLLKVISNSSKADTELLTGKSYLKQHLVFLNEKLPALHSDVIRFQVLLDMSVILIEIFNKR